MVSSWMVGWQQRSSDDGLVSSVQQAWSDGLASSCTPESILIQSTSSVLQELYEASDRSIEQLLPFIEEVAETLLGRRSIVGMPTRLTMWEHTLLRSRPSIKLASSEIGRAYSRLGHELFWMITQLRSDPLWNTSTFRKHAQDFQSELWFVELINEHPELEGYQSQIAPLEGDLLYGVDLSIQRSSPRGRAWIQLTLSAEEDIHQKKRKRLSRSAASGLLSPYTLQQCADQHLSTKEFQMLWSSISDHPPPCSSTARARFIKEGLLRFIRAKDTAIPFPLARLIKKNIDGILGRPAKRKFRPKRPNKIEVSPLIETILHNLT